MSHPDRRPDGRDVNQNITIETAGPDRFREIADYVLRHSQSPATHCIQAETAADADGIEKEIRDLTVTNKVTYVVATARKTVGVIGCEYVSDLGQGWLRGPFARQDDWEGLSQALYARLITDLPIEITRIDSF